MEPHGPEPAIPLTRFDLHFVRPLFYQRGHPADVGTASFSYVRPGRQIQSLVSARGPVTEPACEAAPSAAKEAAQRRNIAIANMRTNRTTRTARRLQRIDWLRRIFLSALSGMGTGAAGPVRAVSTACSS